MGSKLRHCSGIATPHRTPHSMTEPEMKLPDVPLSELPESTKDFLIAHSLTGKTVTEVIRDLLNESAARSGFANQNQPA